MSSYLKGLVKYSNSFPARQAYNKIFIVNILV